MNSLRRPTVCSLCLSPFAMAADADSPAPVSPSIAAQASAPVPLLFVDPSVWQPQQEKLRETIPARLASLMKISAPPAK